MKPEEFDEMMRKKRQQENQKQLPPQGQVTIQDLTDMFHLIYPFSSPNWLALQMQQVNTIHYN